MAADRTPPDAVAIARVHIERRGGFAGLRASADCDAAALGDAGRVALCHLIDSDAARRGGAPSPAPDRFVYRLRVTRRNGLEQTLDVPEDAMPALLSVLVRPVLP